MKVSNLFFWPAVVANALCMLVLTFYFMTLPWLAGDEKLLIWSTSAVQLLTREPPPPEGFALVNTSYDLKLIDRLDQDGFPVGQQAITDRAKLANLLEILSGGKQRPDYIITDIHFVDPSPDDDRLYEALRNSGNTVISSHLGDDDRIEFPLFKDVESGLSDYVSASVFDGVYKYQLVFRDSLLLTPLKVYSKLNNQQVSAWGPFVKVGDHWTLNHFILNYRLLQKDLVDDKADFNPVNLGELLSLPEDDIRAFANGKILVLGDFLENDMHETLFEVTSGPVILLNAYLSIKAKDTTIGPFFFLLLFAVYLLLSYRAFHYGRLPGKMTIFRLRGREIEFPVTGFTGYLAALISLSLFTFFIYNIHLNVFFLACAFYAVDRFAGYVRDRKPPGR